MADYRLIGKDVAVRVTIGTLNLTTGTVSWGSPNVVTTICDEANEVEDEVAAVVSCPADDTEMSRHVRNRIRLELKFKVPNSTGPLFAGVNGQPCKVEFQVNKIYGTWGTPWAGRVSGHEWHSGGDEAQQENLTVTIGSEGVS